MDIRPTLEIRHLQMLVAIAQTGNVTQAATRLGLTQSALSHRIREAERRLGVELFTRLPKRLRMTAAAERLLRTAQSLLTDLVQAEADIKRIAQGIRAVVRLSIATYSSYHWLPKFLTALADVDPAIEVEPAADVTRRPLTALLDGAIDIAIMAGPVDHPALHSVPLFRDPLVAIMAPRHPLATKQVLQADDFREQTFITYSFVPEPGHEYERLLRPAKVMPSRLLKVELPEAIIELVKAGLGISILARWVITPHLRSGDLAWASVTDDGLALDWFALVRKTDGPDSPAHRVTSILAEWCASANKGFTA